MFPNTRAHGDDCNVPCFPLVLCLLSPNSVAEHTRIPEPGLLYVPDSERKLRHESRIVNALCSHKCNNVRPL